MSNIIIGLTMLIGLLTGYIASVSQGPTFGSTVQGNDYSATSTRDHVGVALPNYSRLKETGNFCVSGALARVTITGAGAGQVRLWNATTTNPNLRAPSMSSSTILLAQFPVSAAANTYDFDLTFNCGLLYEIVGTAPTSTIVWR